jgi:hypothetical protein
LGSQEPINSPCGGPRHLAGRSVERLMHGLDADEAIQAWLDNAARALAEQVQTRACGQHAAGENLAQPRPK